MSDYIQASVTIVSLVNPVICGAMFVEATAGRSRRSQLADATRTIAAVFVILAIAALVGVKVLSAFGVSLDAFRVAGGIVLMWMGFSMLRGSDSHKVERASKSQDAASLTPLILFAASPGTIAGVITIAVTHSGEALPISALVGVTATLLVTWCVMLVVARSEGKRGGGGLVHDVVTRFMGLIVLAMGVQFALAGLRTFMGG